MFATFEIFFAGTTEVQWEKLVLAPAVVAVSVERWHKSLQALLPSESAEAAVVNGLQEIAANIVPDKYVGPIDLQQLVNNSKRILHPVHSCKYTWLDSKQNNSLQLPAADHITYDQNVPMPTQTDEDASDGEQCKHLLASFRPRILPAFDAD